jgi:hypothetical protein
MILILSLVCFLIAALTDWRDDWYWSRVRVGWFGLALFMVTLLADHYHALNGSEICVVLALVCFLIATFTYTLWPRFRIGWLGLGFFIASMLIRT